jgi:hypothetical protein
MAASFRLYHRHGLLWSELVAWWSEVTPGANAANLGARLQQSLASDAERKLFATYFKLYRAVLGEALPALLPQVYLHHDPAVVKTLRNRLPLPRPRMDFLLLLPGRQRIVLEVDGRHHFSENDHPSLEIYADMVSADRELRLAGYEVYRFGANELVGEGAESRVAVFLKSSFDCIASCSEVPPCHIKRPGWVEAGFRMVSSSAGPAVLLRCARQA